MMAKSYRNGIRNNYRGDMPLSEVVLKDIKEAAGDLKRWILNGFKLPVIVTWPDYPSKRTTIFKIARLLRYRLTNHLVKDPALIIYFEDSTTGSSEALSKSYPGRSILNRTCTDISKVKVDQMHLDVFGYNTFIDPTKYAGKAVVKSDINALHDGQIVNCPLIGEPDGSKVYQVLIDNGYDESLVMDYRVPVVFGKIPHVYMKFKHYDFRFTNEVRFTVYKETDDVLYPEEQKLIKEFALKMGGDFCELDVLRNNTDAKVYVIDVNKTPYGPPFGLREQDVTQAIQNLADVINDHVQGPA
jgi:hypothetical protein